MTVANKSVLLTGGAGAIGSLVAERLIAQGAHVTIVDRATGESPGATFWEGDLSTSEGIAAVARGAATLAPDILINLAGVQYFGLFERQASAEIISHYMINLVAPALLAQAVIPAMRQRGNGQIANIGSIFGSINFAHFTSYSSAKAGLRGLSEALRRELRGSGIGVTYIAPRAVRAGLSTGNVMRYAEMTKMHLDEPQEVADRIVYAVATRQKDVLIGALENIFVRLNAVLPRLMDRLLAPNDQKARELVG